MDYFNKFLEVIDALERENVEYILVGGFAVILYGLPRLTEDIDLFVKPDDKNISNLKKALLSVFMDESVKEISLEMLNEYPVVRYGSPDGFYIDILCRLGHAFIYEDLICKKRIIDGHPVRVASVETLYAMKKDTVRPIDKEDSIYLQNLLKIKDNEK